jgi:adenine-specific DNA-methyltransferase
MGNVVPRSVWSYDDVGHTQAATTDLKSMFGGKQVFDSPKPVRLLKRIVELGCIAPDDLVLDFFAGSGTTAHACFTRATEGTSTRFIMVQLPEPIEDSSFGNIADITKERLRRAGKKIREEWEVQNSSREGAKARRKEEQAGQLFSESESLRDFAASRESSSPPDTGFRVFKLDSTNIREWDPDRENLAASLEASVDHLKSNRSEQDILFELLLKLGLDLCVPIEQRKIGGKTVHSIGAGVLITCLDKSIARADAEPLAQGILAWCKELNTAGDSTLVFRDSAFADDVAKTNLSKILEQNGIAAKNIRSL